MSSLELTTPGPQETRAVGRCLGELAHPGDVYLLVGELGTGKTCLTQGIASGLGIQEYTLSPTFVLMRELYGRLTLYHIDLYRLDDLAEVADLGLDDYFYGGGLCVVEWADKAMDVMPPEHLLVELEHLGGDRRRLSFTPRGQRYTRLVRDLAAAGPVPEGG